MKVVIAGATGMVGSHLLKIALANNEITEVISFVRKAKHPGHPKLKEIELKNFEDYSERQSAFQGLSAAFFCIGVYTGQVNDADFKRITVDFAVRFAEAVAAGSPQARFCMLSGAGADQTEKSRTAFARYKGMAENQIAVMDLDFYSFRPAYIYPVEKRKEPNFMYRLSRRLYPIIKLFGENMHISSHQLAESLLIAGMQGAPKSILENIDIRELSQP